MNTKERLQCEKYKRNNPDAECSCPLCITHHTDEVEEMVQNFKRVATTMGGGNVLLDGWEDELATQIKNLTATTQEETIRECLIECDEADSIDDVRMQLNAKLKALSQHPNTLEDKKETS